MLVTMETSSAIALKIANLRAACARFEQGDAQAAKSIRHLCLRFHAEGLSHEIPTYLDCTLIKAWNE